MTSSSARGVVLALAGLGSAVALAACGSSGSSSGSGASAEQHKSATAVLADAKSALFNSKAVHVDGVMGSGSTAETVHLQLQGAEADGTVTIAGSTIKIINTGSTLYLNAPATFWTKTAGAAGAALGGKWIKVSGAQAGSTSELTLQGIAASLNDTDSPLNPTTTTGTVSGQKAIILTQKNGSQFFVADSSTPLPLKLVNKGSAAGGVTFTGYGKTQTISAPAGAVTPQQAAVSASPTASA